MTGTDPLARSGAEAIRLAFELYRRQFQRVTVKARERFEMRDWVQGQLDAAERLELYRLVAESGMHALQRALKGRIRETRLWMEIKTAYSDTIDGFADVELAETFFNSITRRIFATSGVDPDVEYVDRDFRLVHPRTDAESRKYYRISTTPQLVHEVLADFSFAAPFADAQRDAGLVGEQIDAAWTASDVGGASGAIEMLEVLDSVFYRGSAAFLVGRVLGANSTLPVVLVLVHPDQGIEIDAVLLRERDVSVVFSYTRSYFHVDVRCPTETIRFLSSIMPKKPLAELYNSIGFHKHGKTEMFRDLRTHLRDYPDRFDFAPGEKGMVMIVFAAPSYEYVFKIIRDRFAYPKTTTREDVLRRYQLVFKHDRAGRLVEAQEFEHLEFERDRFSSELLEELEQRAANSVTVDGDVVRIHHLYVERRVRPLNLFLREAEREDARLAVLDYGQAIRDLAATNIFPGDMLLKNFGVTNNGRVIFYDYDELCLVTDCKFRDMPTARDDGEEMSAEPWFYVGENDVFPEEFIRFMGLTADQRETFMAAHADVVTADFWRGLQGRHNGAEVLDIFPYPPSKRLRAPAETRSHSRPA
jgi:isocitrate dehydrogenase kinase/phosphatase